MSEKEIHLPSIGSLPNGHMARSRPCQSQQPGTSPGSPTGVAVVQGLGPSFTAFPGTYSNRHSDMGQVHSKHRVNPLGHRADPRTPMPIKLSSSRTRKAGPSGSDSTVSLNFYSSLKLVLQCSPDYHQQRQHLGTA